MTNLKKTLASRYAALLLLKEPYEMTYWKNKLNTPLHRLIEFVKERHSIYAHPFALAK
jgi:hypothetical protein